MGGDAASFFGGREPRDICVDSTLNEIPELRSRTVYSASISVRESDVGGRWTGERGFIHDLVARKLRGDFKGYEYYLAGPPR